MDDYSNDEFFAAARLGIHAERFYDSEVGQALIKKAVVEKRVAIEEFAEANLADKEAIRKLQLKVQLPALALKWIGDIINEGKAAEMIINEQDNQD